MNCSNSPGSSDSDVDITDYDSDATEVQCWKLVGSANLRETDGSYVAALELAIHSLQTPGDPEDGTLQAGPREAALPTSDAVQPFHGRHEPTVLPEAGHFFQTGRQATFGTAHAVPPFHDKNEEGPPSRNARHPFQAANQEATSTQDAAHPFQNDDEATPVPATARTPFQTCRQGARAPPETGHPFQSGDQEAPTAHDTAHLLRLRTVCEGAPSPEAGLPFKVPSRLSPTLLDAVQLVHRPSGAGHPFQTANQEAHSAQNASRPFRNDYQAATTSQDTSYPFQTRDREVSTTVHAVRAFQDENQQATTTATSHTIHNFQADSGHEGPLAEIGPLPEAAYPFQGANQEVTTTRDTGDPVHHLVDGPRIWEMVQQTVGQNWSPADFRRAVPSDIPRFSLPGPWPCAVIPCTRFSSMGRDFSKETWLDEVQRGFDASQTFLRFQAVTSPAIIFPWVRVQSSTKRFVFGPHENTPGIRERWTHVKNAALRLRELQHFLRALPPGLDVWFLSIGIDGFTTELFNLLQIRQWWPFLRFHLAIMERDSFPRFRNGIVEWNGVDLCPSRPEVGGLRFRVFSFDHLLDAQPTGLNFELCMLWRVIREGKTNGRKALYSFTSGRNRFPVVPGGQEHDGRL